MKWHYSQVLVEEFWEENCLDGEQFVPLNKTPTASAYCSKDRMKAFSRLSPSGMTFAPLMESLGEELLMWFLEGFHVQTSQLLEKGLESRENKVASGQKWQGLLARYSPDLHLLKTAQCSLLEDSTQYSVTLPRWGLMQNGDVFQQPKSEQITKGIESGLSLRMWPTPTAGDHARNTIPPSIGKSRGFDLSMKVLQVEIAEKKTGGQLCPIFVEYLMGWPLEWTDLKPLEMDKFQKWLELHGRY